MKNHLLKKVLALSLFVSGISVFVLHQSGYFSGNGYGAYQGSHNGGTLTLSDSLYQQKRDSLKRRIQSSSKSIIPDAQLEEMADRLLRPPKEEDEFLRSSKVYIPVDKDMKPESDSLPESPRKLMPSSKLAIPSSFFDNRASDSIKADTINTFTNKKKQ